MQNQNGTFYIMSSVNDYNILWWNYKPLTGVTAPYNLQSMLSGMLSISLLISCGNGAPPL